MSVVHATRGVYGPAGGSPVAMATGGSYVANWSTGAAPPAPTPAPYVVQSHMYEHRLLAADNDLAVPKGFPEPMQFSQVNNSMREYMSRKVRLQMDAGGAGVADGEYALNTETNGYDLVVQSEQALSSPPDGCEITFRTQETNPNPVWLAMRPASYLDNGKYGIFDSAPNEYVGYGQTDDLAGQSQATWSAWLRLSSNYGSGYQGNILTLMYGGGGWRFATDPAYAAELTMYTPAGTTARQVSGSVFTPGQWHHFAAVFSSGVATLYIDGVAVSSTTYGTFPTSIQPAVFSGVPSQVLKLGDNFGQHANSADLRHVAYWAGTAATAAQVAELYALGAAPNLQTLPTLTPPTFWAPLTGTWDLTLGSQSPTVVGSPTFGGSAAVSALSLAGEAYPLQYPRGGAIRGGVLQPDIPYRAVFNEQLGAWRLLAEVPGTRKDPGIYSFMNPDKGEVELQATHVGAAVVCETDLNPASALTIQIPDSLEQRWPIGESIELINIGHQNAISILPPPNGNLTLLDWPPSNLLAIPLNDFHYLKLLRVDALNVLILGIPGAVY